MRRTSPRQRGQRALNFVLCAFAALVLGTGAATGEAPERPGARVISQHADPTPRAVGEPAAAVDASPKSYVFGFVPFLTPRLMEQRFVPLAASLSDALGATVRLRTSSTFVRFEEKLATGEYDFALVQPFDVVGAAAVHYEVLARVDARSDVAAWVAETSRVESLDDLRGQHVGAPDRRAAVSQLGEVMLRQAGLVPGRDLELRHFLNHASCLQQLLAHRVEACLLSKLAVEPVLARMNARLRPVGLAPRIPQAAMLAHRRLPQQTRESFQAHLLSLAASQAGRRVLSEIHVPGFVAATSEDYDAVRHYRRLLQR